MLKRILKLLFAVLLLLIIIVLIQTFRFTKEIPHTKASAIPALNDSSIAHISEAIQIKTIPVNNNAAIDTAAFTAFRNFLEKSYPLVHQHLQRTIINHFSYIYYWQGKNNSLPPYILMAHSDVVPVEASSENLWLAPPFSGKITDTAIWGRGAIDDKGCLISIMEAVEKLLSENYQPERSFYLSFGHDEELGGERGTAQIVKWMEQNKVHPALVSDEGGIITKDNFKDLGRPIALLGVSEKGLVSFELSVEKEGGHSSMPAKETAIDILTKALVKIREEQMPVHFTTPTNAMLNKIGPGLGFTTRMALANRWLFEPLLVKQLEGSNGTNATIHTTIVPTIVDAGIKDNVVPSTAKAIVNSRILPGETTTDVLAFLKKKINDDRVLIKITPPFSEPGKTTEINGPAYKIAEQATYKVMDDVVPVPFLMIGATDSRYYRSIADAVIEYSPMLDPKGFHGLNERIGLQDLQRLIFYYQLILKQ